MKLTKNHIITQVIKVSFSTQVKNELSRIIPEDKNVRIAELAALIRMSGSLQLMGYNKLSFKVVTENAAIARKVFSLLKMCFNIHVEIQVKKNKNLKKVYIDSTIMLSGKALSYLDDKKVEVIPIPDSYFYKDINAG